MSSFFSSSSALDSYRSSILSPPLVLMIKNLFLDGVELVVPTQVASLRVNASYGMTLPLMIESFDSNSASNLDIL